MTYDELFQIKGLKDIKLHAGKSILAREITGAHTVEIIESQDFIKSGVLVFVSGVAFTDPKEDLKKMITTFAAQKAAGLVLEIGPYITEVTDEIIALANEQNLPLMSLPYEVIVSEIISRIYYEIYNKEEKNHSMERYMTELLYGDLERARERIKLFPYNPEEGHKVLFINGFLKKSETYVRDVHHMKDLNWAIHRACKGSVMSLQEEDGIMVLTEATRDVKKLQAEISTNFQMRLENTRVCIGVGNEFETLEDVRRSLKEARGAMNVAMATGKMEAVNAYATLGIYRIFLNMENEQELHNLYHETLDKLVEYDKSTDGELFHTLKAHIEGGCNITKTTDMLFVHRNTVKYRLKRIEEILEVDLDDAETQFELKLAFVIGKYLSIRHLSKTDK